MNSSTITTAAADNNVPARKEKPLAKWLQRIDQSEHANFVIDAWLALDPNSQDGFLAQLIAAAIHDGPGTALEYFASTGRLLPEQALAELNLVVVPFEREPWLDALGRYIISQSGDRS